MIQLDDLLKATGGQVRASLHTAFHSFGYDSRSIQPGQLFCAVVTETGDGHDHIAHALAGGATGVLCQRIPDEPRPDVTWIQVANTHQALLDYARHIVRARSLQVIGIGGSVGKTTTKEIVADILAGSWPTFRNPGSYNGRFGLPIALGYLEREHQIAVLEMAADSPNEIAEMAAITQPRIAIVTRVGSSHLRFFGSLQRVAAEQASLVRALPSDGLAILNADDPLVAAMAAETKARVVTYGLEAEADYVGEAISTSLEGTRLVVRHGNQRTALQVGLVGAHHAYVVLAAVACACELGVPWDRIRAAVAGVAPIPGRMHPLEGIAGSTLLDDSFSATPESAAAALEALSELPAARRIAVLGDMSDLGPEAESSHRMLGRAAARSADILVTKGELSALAAQAAREAGLAPRQVHVTYSVDDTVRLLRDLLQPGDLVLIKGGTPARMEGITRALLAAPLRDGERVPRQDAGWREVRLQRPGRPTWVEIDLDAIAQNVRLLGEMVGSDVRIMAILKADGYGHGAVKVARTALNNGAQWLGVACVGEALLLREAGIDAPILILGYSPAWQSRDIVLHNLRSTVFALETAEALNRAARDLGRTARVHIKVDTGMGRLGLFPQEVVPLLQRLAGLEHLQVEGIFTHLSDADADDLAYTQWQLDRFDALLQELEAQGLRPALAHAANSAATIRVPSSHYEMVRVGIALYGLNPSPEAPCPDGFRPAFAFKSEVAQVKTLPVGHYVSYGRTYRADHPVTMAVIPVGYADGFRRAPRTWRQVLVRGQRAPIIGRVCMDQTMIDVSHIPGVRQGDQVVLIGQQGQERITVDDVAHELGTINYEVVSEILARVPRVV